MTLGTKGSELVATPGVRGLISMDGRNWLTFTGGVPVCNDVTSREQHSVRFVFEATPYTSKLYNLLWVVEAWPARRYKKHIQSSLANLNLNTRLPHVAVTFRVDPISMYTHHDRVSYILSFGSYLEDNSTKTSIACCVPIPFDYILCIYTFSVKTSFKEAISTYWAPATTTDDTLSRPYSMEYFNLMLIYEM